MNERILVVDDDADMRKLMSAILRREGYDVAEAAGGDEALGRGPELAPDLVLLDVVMPGLDGFAVCEQLKGDARTADVPVIFLSGRGEVKDEIRGLQVGAADYVTKPFDRGELLARVGNQLKIRRLTREVIEANRELREKQRRLDEDLRAAAAVQMELLPQKMPSLEGVKLAWRFEPSQVIGGDIFNVFRADDRTLGLYMVDVSGHGVPAALLTASISQALRLNGDIVIGEDGGGKRSPRSPKEVLERLDREYPLERFDRYFTIVYALLDTKKGALVYSSAGHPPPLLIRAGRRIQRLDKGGTIIGWEERSPSRRGGR
ncbi:MAG: response regulator, partial [Syntrophales bacterium]|nr:response regulator [Syntrophales bacterium]